MKNLVNKSYVILFLLFVQQITFAQRNIAWVHGLNDNDTAFQHYDQIFDAERNINSVRASYNTNMGLNSSSNEVINRMDFNLGANNNNPQNMGIGHSMGGLMLRNSDRITPATNKRFGGLITISTPNYGAGIANSIDDGSAQQAGADACNKLADGPLSQIFSLAWAITSNLTTNSLCNKFITNDLFDDFSGSPTTRADLQVGSNVLGQVNAFNTNIPQISITASENSPVHWRMLSTSQFGNDETLVGYVDTARAVYNGFYIYNTSMAVVSGVIGFFNPFAWFGTALYTYRATQWYKGRNWIDDSETIWTTLIRSSRRELETYWEYELIYESDPNSWYEWVYIYWGYAEKQRWVTVNYPNDGLIPSFSQELQNIPTENKYVVSGANHLEVLNMTTDGNAIDESAVELRKIFDRPQGDWFRTN